MFRVVVVDEEDGSTTVEEDAVVDVDGLLLFALLNGHKRSCCLLREANFAIVEEVVRSIIRYYCIV